jgi:hypothetical protein
MLVPVTDDYADRFDDASYADDVLIRVVRVDRYDLERGDELWIPERLWDRIRCLGMAYELHLTPLFDGSTDPVFLNKVQVVQLDRELAFLAHALNDPLLASWIDKLVTLLRRPSQHASKDAVGIEFP